MSPAIRQNWEKGLRDRPVAEWASYLQSHSGLPGPRGNLELADAFAAVADREMILRLAALDDEYLRFCGTEAIGRLVAEEAAGDELLTLLRLRATDARWRVREGAARALQIVGDIRPRRMRSVVADWVMDPDPYVRRAAVAAICEPRLLRDPAASAEALEACRIATDSIMSEPPAGRRADGLRNLRQALGYCWSVAIAANPAAGLPALDRLRGLDDPDVQWIVRSNLTKARLRSLLPDPTAGPLRPTS
jgi:hypothetical protein